jgi:hypothetical protein
MVCSQLSQLSLISLIFVFENGIHLHNFGIKLSDQWFWGRTTHMATAKYIEPGNEIVDLFNQHEQLFYLFGGS